MNSSFSLHLPRRPRRNRALANVRALVQETKLHRDDLIQPLFFHAGSGSPEEINSMPGMVRHTISSLLEECRTLCDLGIAAVALFPCIDSCHKASTGAHALDPKNILYQAIREIKSVCPELVLIADVALDPYTSHGHDCLLDEKNHVKNDATVEVLARLAVATAEAGADIVAPSDMMDGRVKAIRSMLDDLTLTEVGIMAYSAKYASAFYGPFRDAVGSAQKMPLDKRGYQMDPANVREALLETKLDEEEGADILMVKPAGAYLDIIRAVREATLLPVAAYQVSGEYAQIHAAARLGWLDYKAARNEALLAIKRAGANIILTYFAGELLREWA
ncbi:MAG: porphobilinogen synthase [Verrucomicrobiae bacterium]|nr:porphobilinogen synthase [Verrucomicrobiae bacterium]